MLGLVLMVLCILGLCGCVTIQPVCIVGLIYIFGHALIHVLESIVEDE